MEKKIVNDSLFRSIVRECMPNVFNKNDEERFVICEGIEYRTFNRTVKFTDAHEDNVNTSVIDNPIKDMKTVKGITVWSIFKRKQSHKWEVEKEDGNPLLYALKNIGGWRLESEENKKAFLDRLETVVDKFISMYDVGITVVVPSRGGVNDILANMIKKKAPKCNIIGDVMRKLSIDEVWDGLSQLNSPFRKKFGRTPDDWSQATKEMSDAFKKMEKLREGYFTYHLTPKKYRNAITTTLAKDEITCAKYAPMFFEKNILVLDDSISRGSTINNACNIIKDFAPQSITVLTLFSRKYASNSK